MCVCPVQATASNSLKQSGVLVQNAWGNLKDAGLRRYITSNRADGEEVNQPRLESSSSSLTRRLIELFEQLFFTPKVSNHQNCRLVWWQVF